MRGGKRNGAGRPKGQPKKKLFVTVKPETSEYINKAGVYKKSLGEVIDDLVEKIKPKLKNEPRPSR